jgi:hypothetical protein
VLDPHSPRAEVFRATRTKQRWGKSSDRSPVCALKWRSASFCRVKKKGCARQNTSRVAAVRLDQSCAWEAHRAESHRAGWLSPFHHNHEQNPALVPTANPADAPTINVIANGDFSEEPQKLSLNLHGDPCIEAGQSRPPATNFAFNSDQEFYQERFGRWDAESARLAGKTDSDNRKHQGASPARWLLEQHQVGCA